MFDPVTYYGPELEPSQLVIRTREPGEKGLVSLSRPDSEDIIVTGVRMVDTPEVGCAVAVTEDTPAPEPVKKGKGK